MSPSSPAWISVLGSMALAAVLQLNPASSQVIVQQIQSNSLRNSQEVTTKLFQESDYILSGQAGNTLLNPLVTIPQFAGGNQAHSVQAGNRNISNIDMKGADGVSNQFILGNQNTVSQQQSGNRNMSNIYVIGNGNEVSTIQQDVSGATATVNVLGSNNSITTEQMRNAGPITITRTGNGGVPVSVTRR